MSDKIYVIRMFTPDPYQKRRHPNNGVKDFGMDGLKRRISCVFMGK